MNDLVCLLSFLRLAGLRTSSNPPCNLTPAQAYAARWDLSPVPRSTVIVPRREASLDTPSNRTTNHLQPNQTSKQQQPSTTQQQAPSARLRTKTISLDCGLQPALCPKSGIVLPSSVPSSAPPCTLPPPTTPCGQHAHQWPQLSGKGWACWYGD